MIIDDSAPLPRLGFGIQSWRLTVFALDMPKSDWGPDFQKFFGFSHQNETRKVTERRFDLDAKIENLTARLSVTSDRIEFALSVEPSTSEEAGFYVCPSTSSCAVAFENSSRNFLQENPTFRFGVGHTFIWHALNRVESYRRLASLVNGLNLESPEAADFFYRINRPRNGPENLDNIKINRLSQWSAIAKVVTVIDNLGTPKPPVELGIGSLLNTDISTPLETDISTLSKEALGHLLGLMLSWSMELSDKGDIP